MLKRCQEAKFFEAIHNSDVEEVKQFLEKVFFFLNWRVTRVQLTAINSFITHLNIYKEVNVNAQNNDGYTAFHVACCQQSVEIVDLLLGNGYMKVDTEIKTRIGDSALFLILTGYCEKVSAIIVKKLVEYDRGLADLADSRGFTPLQASSR